METNHTKGPWKIVKKPDEFGMNNKGMVGISGSTWIQFAGVFNGKDNGAKIEARANIKLIAAAPDLLDALQNAIRLVDLWAPKYTKEEIKECHIGEMAALAMMRSSIEKAIKKATE